MTKSDRPLLAAALIVRDEESTIDRCLRSLEGVCDEVVVVDTGSTDATTRLVRALGVPVHEIVWPGSFGAARNVALSLVRAEWTLVIDADEELVTADAAALRSILVEVLGDDDVLAAWVRQRPRTGWTACDELRLIRNRPELRFEGRVHESLWPALGDLVDAGAGRVARVPLELLHHGYEDPDVLVAKARRDLPLLEAELCNRPDDTYLQAVRAKCLERLGRGEAALTALQSRLALGDNGVVRLLLLQLQDRLGVVDDDLLAVALAEEPDDVDLCWLAAVRAHDLGDHEQALVLLGRLVATDEDALVRRSRPRAQVGEWAWELMGRSALALGRHAEARDAFRAAVDASSVGGTGSSSDAVRCRALALLADRVA